MDPSATRPGASSRPPSRPEPRQTDGRCDAATRPRSAGPDVDGRARSLASSCMRGRWPSWRWPSGLGGGDGSVVEGGAPLAVERPGGGGGPSSPTGRASSLVVEIVGAVRARASIRLPPGSRSAISSRRPAGTARGSTPTAPTRAEPGRAARRRRPGPGPVRDDAAPSTSATAGATEATARRSDSPTST